MTISSVVHMMSCCASRNPRQWQNTSRLAMTNGNPYSGRTCSSHSRQLWYWADVRDMATIETHSKSPVDTIPRFSKAEMSNPICFVGEHEIIPYSARTKPLPPSLPQHDLPNKYFEVQRISYERSGVKVLRAGNQHISNTPPTETAFRENALRGNLAVAIWRDCLETDSPALDPTENGWYHPEGSATLSPNIVRSDSPLVPAKLRMLLKCGCSIETPCATARCSCKTNELSRTIVCHCREEEDCYTTTDHLTVVRETDILNDTARR